MALCPKLLRVHTLAIMAASSRLALLQLSLLCSCSAFPAPHSDRADSSVEWRASPAAFASWLGWDEEKLSSGTTHFNALRTRALGKLAQTLAGAIPEDVLAEVAPGLLPTKFDIKTRSCLICAASWPPPFVTKATS